jgi:hypothetical protein
MAGTEQDRKDGETLPGGEHSPGDAKAKTEAGRLLQCWRGFHWTGRLLLLGVVIAAGMAVVGIVRSYDTADLEVGQITPAFPSYPAGAIPYSLPRRVLVLDTTTQVTGCAETRQGEQIRGTTELTLSSDVEVDPTQQYYIYVNGVWGKNLSYEVQTYDNGMLKTVSASITDQVAPIVASTAGSLVNVLRLAPPPVGAPALAVPPAANCHDLNAAISANPKDARLTIAQEDIWAPSLPYSLRFDVHAPLGRLAGEFKLSQPYWASDNALVELDAPQGAPAESSDIKFVPPACPAGAGTCATRPPLVQGLVLRNAVRSRVRAYVCDAACNMATPQQGERPEAALTQRPSVEAIMPQFGVRFLVRVHSGFAQDGAAIVAMSADGVITRLQVQSTSSFASDVALLHAK